MKDRDHDGPMLNPPHLGELSARAWKRSAGLPPEMRTRHAVTPAESHHGAGRPRLGHRRALDADAGELRTRTGAQGTR